MLRFRTSAIRRVHPDDLADFKAHLIRLDPNSRRARYGRRVSDRFLCAYAEQCVATDTVIYGHFENGAIRGVGELHLEPSPSSLRPHEGELAFSVESRWRRRGIAAALMDRLLLAARNRRVSEPVLVCAPDNAAMLALARSRATLLTRGAYDVKGRLFAPGPTLLSRIRENADDAVHRVVSSAERLWHRAAPSQASRTRTA